MVLCKLILIHLIYICSIESLDILFINGRVIDPESNTDKILNVGIKGDKIEYISDQVDETSIDNHTQIVDISGLILCPGFIDIHAHHQSKKGNEYQARDGVTTSLELEIGSYPINLWYNKRIQNSESLLNYGVSVGHVPLRLYISNKEFYINDENKNDDDILIEPFVRGIDKLPLNGDWSEKAYDQQEMQQMLNYIEIGLKYHGGLGIGLGIEYVRNGCDRKEIYEIFKLAKKYNSLLFIHVRESSNMASFQEVISNCAIFNTSLHIMHITSSAKDHLPLVLEMIFDGVYGENKLPITTEVYPYTAASTLIDSNVFAVGWQDRLGITYKDLQYVKTGERLTKDTFNRYRENEGGLVILHNMREKLVEMAIKHKDIIISSDGLPFIEDKYGHPRAAGTFSRVLSYYVRSNKVIGLMDAIKKMSYLPAKLLGKISDEFKYRGRIKKGAYADICVFDKDKVVDMGTYTRGAIPSEGIMYVMVNGEFVVKEERIVPNVYPGRALRSNLFDPSKQYLNPNHDLLKNEL